MTSQISLNVLYLEDSVPDFEIISKLLIESGFDLKISRVDTEYEFVESIKTDQYNIILADFSLPGFDAFDALKLCNEYSPEVPFICISGIIGEETAIELLKLGASDYVLKDRPARLPFAIKQALDEVKEKEIRNKAERALLQSEENFRRSISESPLGIRIVTENGKTIFANKSFLDIYDFDNLEEFTNTPAKERYTPESYELHVQRKKLRKAGEDVLNYELSIVRRNGEIRYIQVSRTEILWNSEKHFQVINQDITEQKRAEKALKRSTHELKKVQQITQTGSWYLDVETNEVEWTEELYKMYGFDPNLPVPPYTEHMKLFTKESWDILSVSLAKTSETGIPYELELRTVRNDGTNGWMWVRGEAVKNTEGKTIGLWGAAQDISVRKNIEKELSKEKEKVEESELLLNEMGTIAKVGGWQIDLNTNTLKWTKQVYQIHEVDENYIPTVEKAINFYDKSSQEIILNALKETIEFGNPFDTSVKIITAKGNKIDVRAIGRAIKNVTGGIEFVFGTFQDITEQKLAENALVKNQFYLSKAQKIGKIGTWEMDIFNNKLYWTRQNYKNFGLKHSTNLTYEVFLNCIHPDDRDFVTREWSAALEGKPYDIEHRIITDNNIKWLREKADIKFDETGKAISAIGFTQDITSFKESEQELKESQERFELAMKASKDGLFDWNLVTNEIYYSPGWKLMLGYEDHELPNDFSVWETLTVPEDVMKSWEMQQELVARKRDRFELEFKMKHKNGYWIDVLSRAEAFFNDEGKAIRIVGTHVDITQNKKVQEKLVESEERYRTLFENIPVGVFRSHSSGKVLSANIAMAEMYGYNSVEELLSIPAEKYYKEINPRQVMLEELKKEGFLIDYVTEELKKDGSPIWVSANYRMLQAKNTDGNNDFYIDGVLMDITERKRAEYELELNKKRVDSLLELNQMTNSSLNDIYTYSVEKAVEITDSKIGFLGFVNEDMSKVNIFNWSGAAMNNCQVENYGFEFDVEKSGIWGEVVRTGKPLIINDYNAPNPMKRGTPIGHVQLINYLSVPLFSENRMEAIVAVANKDENYSESDIKQLTLLLNGMWKFSQEQSSKKELQIALEKAKESDRLKSAFLSNMSHEIRTPMNGILGFSELLKEPGLTGEEQQTYIRIIEKSGDRMLNTINDIIDISKIESGQVKLSVSEVNVNEQMQFQYSFFKPEAEKKGIKLNYTNKLPDEVLFIKTDSEKLNSVLTNLIKNAIKYSHKGSIDFGCNKMNIADRSFLQFYVKDTGIGVPANRQNAIFDRFVQADIEDKKVYEGSGLGLAISKAYVEMLGGKIWMESEVGLGSVFYFTIPITIEENQDQFKKMDDFNKEKQHQTNFENLNLKILIAEDDEPSFYLISIVMQKIAKEIIWAKNGVNAVETCLNNPDIDLILMDIQMPGMNGYDATRQIREFNKNVIIIAQTAFAMAGDGEKALEAGCNDYISKPIKKTELFQIIENRLFKSNQKL